MKIILIGIATLVLFALQRTIYKHFWSKNLKTSLGFATPYVTAGNKGKIVQVIENRKRLPLPLLRVKFQADASFNFENRSHSKTTDRYYRNEIFQIGGGEKITRTLPFVAEKRGFYSIKSLDIIGTDLFLSEEYVKKQKVSSNMYVYPRAFRDAEFEDSLQKINGEMLVKRHITEDPFELSGIREYQPFDSIKNINWKATAKTGELLVNQKGFTAMKSVRIYLNLEKCENYNTEAEAAIEIAMGIASYFLSKNMEVSCHTNAKDISTNLAVSISSGAGVPQEESIGRALARVDLKQSTLPFFELYGEEILNNSAAGIMFFVSPFASDTFLQLLQGCEKNGTNYIWYCPRTPFENAQTPRITNENIKYIYIG